MADDTQMNEAPEAQPEQTPAAEAPAPKPKAAKAPKAAPVEDAAPEPQRQRDPMMDQLVAAQRELEAARKELDAHKARVKQFEKDQRKSAILSALVDEFPGLPRAEIRGAALVAAEDGLVDLFSEDAQAQIDKLKEALRPKSKKPSSTAPAPSLGGTPGTAAKPPTNPRGKFLL